MSSSTIEIRWILESTQGTLPAGNMQIIPFENYQYAAPLEREQPGNVSSNRQPVDNPATGFSGSGSGSADVSFLDHDLPIAGVFCEAKQTGVTVTATTISAVASGNTIDDSANGLGSFAIGDFVQVSGLTTNGALFLARITAAAAGSLSTDANFKTLVDEAAGSSITIKHSGFFKQGTTMRTCSGEEWNTSSSKGWETNGVGVSGWDYSVPHPSKMTQSFSLTGMSQPNILASQLANASDAASGNGLVNSNVHFGDKVNATAGLGFRYDGSVLSNLRIKDLKISFQNPISLAGGAGTLGPQDAELDGMFSLSVEITFYRNSADGETLLTDAQNPDALKSIGFGWIDGAGNRRYHWIPKCQPRAGSTTGLKQSDREMGTVSFDVRSDSVYGMWRIYDFAA